MMNDKISEYVRIELERYLHDLGDDMEPSNLHSMFTQRLEISLLEQVLRKTESQTEAARWLGLNRNTLAKKLQQFQLGSQKKISI